MTLLTILTLPRPLYYLLVVLLLFDILMVFVDWTWDIYYYANGIGRRKWPICGDPAISIDHDPNPLPIDIPNVTQTLWPLLVLNNITLLLLLCTDDKYDIIVMTVRQFPHLPCIRYHDSKPRYAGAIDKPLMTINYMGTDDQHYWRIYYSGILRWDGIDTLCY